MGWKQPGIKRLLGTGLGYGIGAAVGSIILVALDGGRPESIPFFFVTMVAGWTVVIVASRVINRLRFKLWWRRGWTELWVRSPEPLPGGLANSWVRGLISVRAPLVDFVTDESRDGAWVRPVSFLVSGRISPERADLAVQDFVAVNFGPEFRVVSLQTTLGPIDVAGYPEALDQLEAGLFGSANQPPIGI